MNVVTTPQVHAESLLATSPRPLPFATDLVARSYLLGTPEGTALIYSSELSADDDRAIRERGEPSKWLLNHWHESMFLPGSDLVERLGATVGAADRAETESRASVAGTIAERGFIMPGLEAIPIPGHTPGATAFVWEAGGDRRLFTGDSLWFDEDGWRAAVLADSDREAYVESLELMAGLEFDVLIPWAGLSTLPAVERVEREEGRRRVLEVAERVRGGADR